MKNGALIFIISFACAFSMTIPTYGQFKLPPKKKANNAGTTNNTIDSTNLAPVNIKPVEQAPVAAEVTYDPNAKSIIKYDTTDVGGYNANKKVSLRLNSAFSTEKSKKKSILERTPLPYQKLREEDAIFSEYVWEEIDGREKLNRPFTYQGYDDSGDQRFFALIMKSIEKGDIAAFSADDEMFTTPIEIDELNAKLKGTLDTLVYPNKSNPNINDTTFYYNKDLSVKNDSIYTFKIKEQYIFDNKTSRMYCRIIGIAPIASISIKGADAFKQTLFWIYYPDFRPILAKHEVYNPKNFTTRMTWEELFESRYFNGRIVKSTIDNYNNLELKDLYKNPIKRLEAGEKIRQRIFTFEQDRWVY
jgi:gliding motility associated protien GldN